MTAGALLATLIGIAMLDSINPSAIAMTVYILLQAPERLKYRSVIAYVCGIFVTYLLLGMALITGITVVLTVLPSGTSRWLAGAQVVLGGAMVLWAITPHRKKRRQRLNVALRPSSMLILGSGVTIVELSTAFPYLAALGLLHQIHTTAINKAALLLVYNTIFVLPPLILLGLYKVRGAVFVGRIKRKVSRHHGSPGAMRWVVGIIGVILMLDNIGELFGK